MKTSGIRNFVLPLLLFASLSAMARTIPWQDAVVTAIDTQHGESGSAYVPLFGGIYQVPMERWATFYVIDTPTVRYVLNNGKNKPLDLTLHGNTKIAPDGLNAYILDDSGKQIKLPVAQKIARKKEAE